MADVSDQNEHGPVLTVTEARGARRGRHMAWVLGISMALIVAGFFALWLSSAGHLASPGGQTIVGNHAAAQGFKAPPPQPRESEAPQTLPSGAGAGAGAR